MSGLPGIPKIFNPDGTVNVHCRECGNFICRMPNQKFTSALCHFCSTGAPRPPAEAPVIGDGLYNEAIANPTERRVGTVRSLFRVLGFMKRKPAQDEGSVQVAKRKKRRPLLSSDDEES